MLLDDIAKNRYRVEEIIQRLMDAEDKGKMSTILQMLVREGRLSDGQFKQLDELEVPDLEKITEIIKDAKIGKGLNFLPRTLCKLRHILHSLLKELEENGSEFIKPKVASILEELFNRNAIRRGEYVNLKTLLGETIFSPVGLAMIMMTKIPQLYHKHDKIRQYGWFIP